jgi:hypothetical protein
MSAFDSKRTLRLWSINQAVRGRLALVDAAELMDRLALYHQPMLASHDSALVRLTRAGPLITELPFR